MNDPDCGCCTGGTDGYVADICVPCLNAIISGDRSRHPHPPSPAQQALIDTEGMTGGGLSWKQETPHDAN